LGGDAVSKPFYIHVINDTDDSVITHLNTAQVPQKGEIIRLGIKGVVRFFEVIAVVWIFDERHPLERVNLGVVEQDVNGERI
jgi:hypothetical protein